MRFYLFLLFFLVTCQPAKKNLNSSQKANYQKLIEAKLGKGFDYQANEDGKYLLCSKIDKSVPGSLEFLVYDLPRRQLIYQQRLENGSVEWESNTIIKITEGLGNRTKENPEGYRVYHVDIRDKRLMDKAPKSN